MRTTKVPLSLIKKKDKKRYGAFLKPSCGCKGNRMPSIHALE
jgi:hypothetical protein